jgi:hypothetical protein
LTSFGLVRLGEVERAVKTCADGAKFVLKKHRYWVTYRGQTFRGLPKGPGRGDLQAEIEFGHVAKMIRMLGLDKNCMYTQLGVPLD